MQKLQLHIGESIHSKFGLKKLNLLFVFQVNCPGCFIYGFPLINSLFKELKEVSFLGISTAFEDFELNTLENTKLLLQKGQLVGETQKLFSQYGHSQLPYSIEFPVAMDSMVSKLKNENEVIDHICELNPNFKIWPQYDREKMQQNVKEYLNNLKIIALSFTLNQLKGTPSFILFNEDYSILSTWFGKTDYREIRKAVLYHGSYN